MRLHGHFKAQRRYKCSYTGVPMLNMWTVRSDTRRALIDMTSLTTWRVRFVNESFFRRVGSYQTVKHDLDLLNESVEQSFSLIESGQAVIDSLNWETKLLFLTSPIRYGPKTDVWTDLDCRPTKDLSEGEAKS